MNPFLRRVIIYIGMLTLVGVNGPPAIHAQAAGDTPSPLLVTIAIPQRCHSEGVDARQLRDNPVGIMDADSEAHFHVLIQNVSPKPVYVWAEDNSEGCKTLSLEITKEDGKKIVLKNEVDNWTSNNITLVQLAPGECQVREIYYASEAAYLSHHSKKPFWHQWSRFPFPSHEDEAVTIQAFFEQRLKGSALYQGYPIWFGKVASQPYQVILDSR